MVIMNLTQYTSKTTRTLQNVKEHPLVLEPITGRYFHKGPLRISYWQAGI